MDIRLLAGHLSELTRRRLGLGGSCGSARRPSSLSGYRWPGNVRDLENVLCRAILKAGFQPADLHDVHTGPVGKNLHQAVEEFRCNLIQQAIEQHQGNWAAAARDLGMDRSNLYNLAARLGVRARSGPGNP